MLFFPPSVSGSLLKLGGWALKGFVMLPLGMMEQQCPSVCGWEWRSTAHPADGMPDIMPFLLAFALKNDSTLEKQGCSATYQSDVFLPDESWDLKAN